MNTSADGMMGGSTRIAIGINRMTVNAGPGKTPVRTTPFPEWPVFGDAERQNLLAVLESGTWSTPEGGPFVTAFEAQFAGMHAVPHAVAVTNGTISLVLSLRALGIGAGDEVIVPAYTFLSTATSVLEVNALPIFVDIDPGTFCIDPSAVEAAISPRTKAIIPVHLGGHPADMERLLEIATRHGLAIIEDAAHAHGSIWNGRPVGGFGEFGSFSMQASKNLNSGEGGVVVTNDADLAARIRSRRNCGRIEGGAWYEHHVLGGNFRLTEFQAAVLVAQLERYPEQIARRDANGRLLDARLAGIAGVTPQVRDSRTELHAQHLYSFRYDASEFAGTTRAEFVTALKAEGIPASAGYPLPLNQQPLFINKMFDLKATGYDPTYQPTDFAHLDLPNTRMACDDVVWISQSALLGGASDMDDIVTAVAKVQDAVLNWGRDALVSR